MSDRRRTQISPRQRNDQPEKTVGVVGQKNLRLEAGGVRYIKASGALTAVSCSPVMFQRFMLVCAASCSWLTNPLTPSLKPLVLLYAFAGGWVENESYASIATNHRCRLPSSTIMTYQPCTHGRLLNETILIIDLTKMRARRNL